MSVLAEAAQTVTFDLKELSKHVGEITPATNCAKILDDYQYLLCRDIERWVDDEEYVKLLRKHRAKNIWIFFPFQLVVTSIVFNTLSHPIE